MKRSLFLAFAVSLMVSAPSLAQDEGFSFSGFFESVIYTGSFGLGAGIPTAPDAFDEGWDPSFGMLIDISGSKGVVELGYTFDYNFFLHDGIEPDDQNIMTNFVTLKIKPLDHAVRPYILVAGGSFYAWRVDADVSESVLGYGGGAGVEVDVGNKRRVFIETKLMNGRTRKTPEKANTEYIPIRIGITFQFNEPK